MKTLLMMRPTTAVPLVQSGLQRSASRLIAEWQRGPETLSGFASRKLRLALAPAHPATGTGVFTNAKK